MSEREPPSRPPSPRPTPAAGGIPTSPDLPPPPPGDPPPHALRVAGERPLGSRVAPSASGSGGEKDGLGSSGAARRKIDSLLAGKGEDAQDAQVGKRSVEDAEGDKSRKDSRACPAARDPGSSNWGGKVSYRDAVVRPRSFKPRFPPAASLQGEGPWLHENSWKLGRGEGRSVWERLGVKKAAAVGTNRSYWGQRSEDGHLLALLKAKACGRRCFNCFAFDHRISQCRDPPRCLVCARSGHKARFCSRARAAAGAPAAPAAGAPAEEAAAAAAGTPAVEVRQRAARGEAEGAKKKKDLMEFTPGDIVFRPPSVAVAVARTQEMRVQERTLELHALVAVQRDARVPLSRAAVLRDAPHQLGIPAHELEVEGLRHAMFLLRFRTPAARNAALTARAFQAGRCMLNIMPWSRRIGASVGKLKYRMRVCLEGVPPHARSAAAIAPLFGQPAFIDEVDCPVEKEAERFCYNVWVWTNAPNNLAVEGTLQLEEPSELPDDFMLAVGEFEQSRAAPVETFDYKVLIHLDRVLDYTPPADSPERFSVDSDSSGIPVDDPPVPEYPECFSYTWRLGYKDNELPPPRQSVHDRLGGRGDRPDRPPPRGGAGGAGSGYRQQPPATWADINRSVASSRDGGGGGPSGYGGRRRVASGPSRVWRPKPIQPLELVSAHMEEATLVSSVICEDWFQRSMQIDPMLEEAAGFSRPEGYQLARPTRSVEPTVAAAGSVLSEHMEWARDEAAMAGDAEQSAVHAGTSGPNSGGHMTEQLQELGGVLDGSAHGKSCHSLDTGEYAGDLQELGAASLAPHGEWGVLPAEGALDQEMQAEGVDKSLTADGPVLVRDGPLGLLHSSVPPDVGRFDLNVACPCAGDLPHEADSELRIGARQVLAMADARLNKEAGHKPLPRGISRLAVPLRKSLLCIPPQRSKFAAGKKLATATVSQVPKRTANGSAPASLSVDEQATLFIMKAGGFAPDAPVSKDEALQLLGEQFFTPLPLNTVGDMRVAFGLPEAGSADALGPLLVEAEDNDHA